MSSNDVLIERSPPQRLLRRPRAASPSRAPWLLDFLPGLLAIADWCAILATGCLANLLVGHGGDAATADQPMVHPSLHPAILPLAIVLAATLTVDFIYLFGGYATQSLFRSGTLVASSCAGWLASAVFFIAAIAALGCLEALTGPAAELWYVMALLYLVAARAAVVWQVAHWRRQGRLLPRVAVLGATREAADLAARLSATHEATVVGLFLEGDPPGSSSGNGSELRKVFSGKAGTTDDLVALATAGAVDQVVLAQPWTSPGSLHRTIARFAGFETMLSIEPALPPLKLSLLQFDFIGGVPAITLQRRPLSGWGAAAKRLEDVVISLVALVLLAPVLLVIAILIKLDSPGPVLFRQERYGFRNNRFFVYKFRSMRHESSEDRAVPQAQRNDPRVTRVGAFLRRSSLDELPQLLNVLWGEMSLVGPRPHAAAHNEKYAQLIDGYLARHRMKPGITGWAQVNGARGGTESPQQMQRRLEYDLSYIANWSLHLDFKVLLMTIPAVLRGTNAY
jgi:putative colanic acid biosynthesis UDP-glucose lipid carrier transferase